jgi:hypothetical protein
MTDLNYPTWKRVLALAVALGALAGCETMPRPGDATGPNVVIAEHSRNNVRQIYWGNGSRTNPRECPGRPPEVGGLPYHLLPDESVRIAIRAIDPSGVVGISAYLPPDWTVSEVDPASATVTIVNRRMRDFLLVEVRFEGTPRTLGSLAFVPSPARGLRRARIPAYLYLALEDAAGNRSLHNMALVLDEDCP